MIKKCFKKKKNAKFIGKIAKLLILIISLTIDYEWSFSLITIENNHFFNILPKISTKNSKINSLKDIFKSRILYINDANITNEYIQFLRPINLKEENKYLLKKKEENIKFYENKKRKNQLNFQIFGKLCSEERLIFSKKFFLHSKPFVSVVLPTYNKEDTLMKSIRSIQNQSLKNIEIIIVDDCSTDKTPNLYKYLLQSDPRIRVFRHLKNLGVWRTRIDGFLYSRGDYVIQFDPGDLYEDNYVLEEAYNIIKKYKIDSVKMLCRFIYNYNNMSNYKYALIIKENYTKIAYQPDIEKYNFKYFKKNGCIWTRLTRKNVLTKSLLLLSSRILNIYKNFWEDIWWNTIINKVSYNLLALKRYSYLYFINTKGEGKIKIENENQRDKMTHEFIHFLYFDLEFLKKENNKKTIINQLKKLNSHSNKIKLSFFKTKFNILDDLLNRLIHVKKSKEKKFYKLKILKNQ